MDNAYYRSKIFELIEKSERLLNIRIFSELDIDGYLSFTSRIMYIAYNVSKLKEIEESATELDLSTIIAKMEMNGYLQKVAEQCSIAIRSHQYRYDPNAPHKRINGNSIGIFYTTRDYLDTYNTMLESLALKGYDSINEDLLSEAKNKAKSSISIYTDTFVKIMSECNEIIKKSINEDDVEEKLVRAIVNSYVKYWDEIYDTLYDDLYQELFSYHILNNPADEPTRENWGLLLKRKEEGLKNSIIAEIDRVRLCIDVRNEDIINTIKTKVTEDDINTLFREISEINILKTLARVDVKLIEYPREDEDKAPELPIFVNEKIRNNNQYNWLFREAIERIAPKTGCAGGTWKWSHVQVVLEHNDFIESSEGDTEFARKIHEINNNIEQEKVRTNTKNNSLDIKSSDKYWDWPQTYIRNKNICLEIEQEFKALIEAMK